MSRVRILRLVGRVALGLVTAVMLGVVGVYYHAAAHYRGDPALEVVAVIAVLAAVASGLWVALSR